MSELDDDELDARLDAALDEARSAAREALVDFPEPAALFMAAAPRSIPRNSRLADEGVLRVLESRFVFEEDGATVQLSPNARREVWRTLTIAKEGVPARLSPKAQLDALGAAAEALAHTPDPRLIAWAELARAAGAMEDGEAVDHILSNARLRVETALLTRVRALCDAGSTGAALQRVEAAEELLPLLGDGLRIAIDRAGYLIDLRHELGGELRRLHAYFPRPDQNLPFLALLDPTPRTWALHVLGPGGVGKTELVRHLAFGRRLWMDRAALGLSEADQAKVDWAATAPPHVVATVDFDNLDPRFPSEKPGLLLLRLAESLRGQIPDTEEEFEKLDRLVTAAHASVGARDVGPGWARDVNTGGGAGVIQAFAALVRRSACPVVLLLDTCEDLERVGAQGSARAALDQTLEVLEALADVLRPTPGALPGMLRVVFSGRRPLADAGLDWVAVRPLGRATRAWIALHALSGFDADAAARFVKGRWRDGNGADAPPDKAILRLSEEEAPKPLAGPPGAVPADARHHLPFILDLYVSLALEGVDLETQDARGLGPRDLYVDIRITRRVDAGLRDTWILPVALAGWADAALLAAGAGRDAATAAARLEDLSALDWLGHADAGQLRVRENLAADLARWAARQPDASAVRTRLLSELEGRATPGELPDERVLRAWLQLVAGAPEYARATWPELEARALAPMRADGRRYRPAAELLARLAGAVPDGHPLTAPVRQLDLALAMLDWPHAAEELDRRWDEEVRREATPRALAGRCFAGPRLDELEKLLTVTGAPLESIATAMVVAAADRAVDRLEGLGGDLAHFEAGPGEPRDTRWLAALDRLVDTAEGLAALDSDPALIAHAKVVAWRRNAALGRLDALERERGLLVAALDAVPEVPPGRPGWPVEQHDPQMLWWSAWRAAEPAVSWGKELRFPGTGRPIVADEWAAASALAARLADGTSSHVVFPSFAERRWRALGTAELAPLPALAWVQLAGDTPPPLPGTPGEREIAARFLDLCRARVWRAPWRLGTESGLESAATAFAPGVDDRAIVRPGDLPTTRAHESLVAFALLRPAESVGYAPAAALPGRAPHPGFEGWKKSWFHARWRAMSPGQETDPSLLEVAASLLEEGLPTAPTGRELELGLDLAELTLAAGGDPDVTVADLRPALDDWLLRHPHLPGAQLRVRARTAALWGEPFAVGADAVARLGLVGAARIVFEEAELLSLRLPGRAHDLWTESARLFAAAGDHVPLAMATVLGALHGVEGVDVAHAWSATDRGWAVRNELARARLNGIRPTIAPQDQSAELDFLIHDWNPKGGWFAAARSHPKLGTYLGGVVDPAAVTGARLPSWLDFGPVIRARTIGVPDVRAAAGSVQLDVFDAGVRLSTFPVDASVRRNGFWTTDGGALDLETVLPASDHTTLLLDSQAALFPWERASKRRIVRVPAERGVLLERPRHADSVLVASSDHSTLSELGSGWGGNAEFVTLEKALPSISQPMLVVYAPLVTTSAGVAIATVGRGEGPVLRAADLLRSARPTILVLAPRASESGRRDPDQDAWAARFAHEASIAEVAWVVVLPHLAWPEQSAALRNVWRRAPEAVSAGDPRLLVAGPLDATREAVLYSRTGAL